MDEVIKAQKEGRDMEEPGGQYGESFLIAVDPGISKCGIAVVNARNGYLTYRRIALLGELTEIMDLLVEEFMPEVILVGDGTGHKLVLELLRRRYRGRVPIKLVPERGTTMRARQLYVAQARNLWDALLRFIKAYFTGELDDLAAYVIAMDYLKERLGLKEEQNSDDGNGRGDRAGRGKRR